MSRYRIGFALGVCLVFAFLVSACYVGYPPTPGAEASPQTPTLTHSQVSSTPTSLPDSPAATPSITPTPTAQPINTIEIKPPELRGQVVRFWHAWKGTQASTIAALIEEFNQSNTWGIQVEATAFLDLDELWKQITIARQAGQAPEIVSGYLHQVLASDARQPVVDLSPYVNDPRWGLSPAEQADFFPAFWQADVIANKRFGLPALRAAQVLVYNLSWARELGFARPPQTPAEFAQQACIAAKANQQDTDPENDGTGGWIISTQPASTFGWLKAFGVPLTKADLSGYQFSQSETEAAFLFLRGLYDQGCAWLPQSEFAEADFAARRGLFMSASSSDLAYQAQALGYQDNQDEWTVLTYPSTAGNPVLPVYGPSYALLPSSPEAQLAAWLFLKWLSAPEQNARWSAATASLPLRRSVLESNIDKEFAALPVQWRSAVTLLQYAQPEPPYASWSLVRWAIHDGTTQVFRDYFSREGVPEMVKLLQETADELHKDERR